MKLFQFLIILLASNILFSQTQGIKALNSALLDEGMKGFYDAKNVLIDIDNIAGSPYLDENFTSGTVFASTTGESLGYQMRYNIYNDEIEIEISDENIIVSLQKSSNYSCKINNDTFRYLDYTDSKNEVKNGYLQELYKSKQSLMLKYNCIYQSEQIGKPPMFKVTPAKFLIKKTYYILQDDKLVLIPSKSKTFLDLFGIHKTKVKTFIKSSKLKANKEKDLIKIINFYNSLLK